MTEEISTQILDAAEARFRTYGFNKTTMAEIASDIDMSTANLYRYFENKVAIGSAMANRCICERETVLNEIISRTGITESERLEIFVLGMMDYMHGQFSNEPKLSELVDAMMQKCPELVHEHVNSDKNLFKKLLQQGNECGEFEVKDVDETASYVQAAIVKFSTHFFITMFPIEELKRLAKGVVSLILNGLVKK